MCRLLWLLPLVLLQACAGNPLAEQLERSFGAVETDPAAAVPADQGTDARTSGSTPTPAAETSKGTITRDGNANNSPQESSPKDSPSKASPSKDISAEGKAKTEPATAQTATAQAPTTEKAPAPADDAGAKPVVKATQPLEPYRITIRLAGADPAAPAEAVTRALRQSDVTFSVERIERVTP